MRRVEEREALAVISALEEVAYFEWLDEKQGQGVRTPDFRVELASGRNVLVEVTMATSEEMRRLLPKHGTEHESNALAYKWRVRVAHRSSTVVGAGRSPTITQLLPRLEPVLTDVESHGGTTQEMIQRAEDRLHQEMQVIDEHLDTIDRRVVRVTEALPRGNGVAGGIEAAVSLGGGVMPEGVDNLVAAIQHRIDDKHEHDQGADWLAVAIDGPPASVQLREGFARGSDSSVEGAQDLSAVDLRGFEEVWVFARTSNGTGHIVLRFSGSGTSWKRSVIEQYSD